MSNNVAAYYRLGDQPGSYACIDSSGLGQTGSLVSGVSGTPSYGYAAAFLSDPNTACDLSAGTNVLNGGFQTVDLSTQPPIQHQPLGSASSWTFECWLKWTATTGTTPGQSFGFSGSVNANALNEIFFVSSLTGLAVGDGITGTNIPAGTAIAGIGAGRGFLGNIVEISQNASAPGEGTYTATSGAVGSTVFSASNVAGLGTSALDVRVGAATTASVAVYNRVTFGPFGVTYKPIGYSSGTINIQDGAWHHLAIPYSNSASIASIYIDGAFDSSWATGASWANPKSITIGCDDGPINGWVGAMQDVALYSSPLSAGQIANHNSIGRWFTQQEYGAAVGGVNAGRFNKVCAVAGLNPATVLTVPYPFRTLLYSETNNVTTTSALNYLQTQSETEPGLIFALPNGMLAAYSRQYHYINSTSVNSQAVFADNSAGSVTAHYDGPSFQLATDDLDTWTDVQVQAGRTGAVLQEWGPTQSAAMAAAASISGSRTLQGLTSLQMQNDSDALAIAQWYGDIYSTPRQRVTSMQTDSYGNQGKNIPIMLGTGIYDRLTVGYAGATPGSPFQADSLVEAITHTINVTNGPIWTTQFALSPYEILLTPFIFGNAAQSQMSGAASVTGSGTSTVTIHTGGNFFLSGTITILVESTPVSVPYNATQGQILTALDNAGLPATGVTGQFNMNNTVVIAFSSSQTVSAMFVPSCVLTL